MPKFQVHYNLNLPYNCKICNTFIKSKSGLGSHIKGQHKEYNYESYLLKFENIDLKKITEEWYSKANERKEKQINGLKKYCAQGLSPKDRMTEEQYNNWRNSMSKVFTLGWFIKKYGEEIGNIKYKERSENISKTTKGKNNCPNNKTQYSIISQEFFWELYKQIDFKEIYFGELNHEYSCGTTQNFDFVIIDNKKIIEFNGDKWHANPKDYNPDDIPMPGFIAKKALQIWEEDMLKNNKARRKGFEILTIWESEYVKNKEKTIWKALNFLYN